MSKVNDNHDNHDAVTKSNSNFTNQDVEVIVTGNPEEKTASSENIDSLSATPSIDLHTGHESNKEGNDLIVSEENLEELVNSDVVVRSNFETVSTDLLDRATSHANLYKTLKKQKMVDDILGNDERVIVDRQTIREARILNSEDFFRDSHSHIMERISRLPIPKSIETDRWMSKLAALTDKNELGVKRNTVESISCDGRESFKKMIIHYLHSLVNIHVPIPLGDLSRLSASGRDKMRLFQDLISMRVEMFFQNNYISDPNLGGILSDSLDKPGAVENRISDDLKSDLFADMLDNPTAYDNSLKDSLSQASSLAEKQQVLSKYLSERTERSMNLYVERMIIMPLIRDVLTQLVDIPIFESVPIQNMARTHSSWVRSLKNRHLHNVLLESILKEMQDNMFLSGLNVLQSSTLYGVNAPLYYAGNRLSNAITGDSHISDPNLQDRKVFAKCEIIEENESGRDKIPVGIDYKVGNFKVTRKVALKNVNGDPRIIVTSMEHPITDIPSSDIVDSANGLLCLWLRHNNVNIREYYSLQEFVSMPDWQFIFGRASDFDSEIAKIHPGILDLIRDVTRIKFFSKLLLGEYGYSPLSSLFSEPNRADLQKSFENNLAFYALADKSYQETVVDVLSILLSSREMEFSLLPDICKKVQCPITGFSSIPGSFSEFCHVKESAYPLVVPTSSGTHTSVVYYVDDHVSPITQKDQMFRSILQRLGSLGKLTTYRHDYAPLPIPGVPYVDMKELMRFSDTYRNIISPMFLINLFGDVKYIRAYELPESLIQSRKDVRLTRIYSKDTHQGSNELQYDDIVAISNVESKEVFVCPGLSYLDNLKFKQLWISPDHNSREIITKFVTNSETMFYAKVDPSLFLHISDRTLSFSNEGHIMMPVTLPHAIDLITSDDLDVKDSSTGGKGDATSVDIAHTPDQSKEELTSDSVGLL